MEDFNIDISLPGQGIDTAEDDGAADDFAIDAVA